MNYRMIARLCAFCLLIEAAFMLIPTAYAVYAGENVQSFLIPIAIAIAIGLPIILFLKPRSKSLYAREGWFSAGIIWIVISLLGALPFSFSGMFKSYIDCFVEIVSGFTTTGSSILKTVEQLPRSILMWRSLTNWIGGIGVLVFLLALMPVSEVDMRSLHLLRAESPGPTASKFVPKMAQTAKLMCIIYFVMTALTAIALVIAKMPFYDSILHAWSAAGTGGFSCKNLSIAYYNSTAINYILGVSMLLFSVNFIVFFNLIIRQFKSILKNTEFLFHIAVVVVSIVLITININRLFPSVGQSVEHAFFQVTTIISTTGFASTDFNLWPTFSKSLLLLLMLMGGCAGSTAGGIKAIRSVILLKTARREIGRLTHPRMVNPVKIGGKIVEDAQVRSVMVFFIIYVFVIIASVLLLSLDNFDFLTTFSATMATVNNIGPGFGMVGATGNFSEFSALSKLVMSFGMLLGRLELYPIIFIFAPGTFKMHFHEMTGDRGKRRIGKRQEG
ncbi:MAG: TrkH family potassium uptake protein [Oscillospiraceae bacterium]|jgi:trk system potassium uptake protein TrkH|nr:TrkH family potassium uptake protein [Oscillospiraceae bacterium]